MKWRFRAALTVTVAVCMGVTTAHTQGVPTKATTVKVDARQPKTVKVEVPIEKPVRSNTPAFRGEGWFQQHCSVCHLGLWVKEGQLKPFAPSLAGVLKDTSREREETVRTYIRRGSTNMPGFQNTFTPAEFDELIAYLKTQ